jgi:RNA polymerase sigma-70 factor, ECF subfamily
VDREQKNNDFLLVQRYLKGNNEAVAVLVERYQNRLHNTIFKICGNYEDALELTQDSFVKAFESIENFQGKSSFYTYLYRIGVNLAINFCNRRKKVQFITIDDDSGSGCLKDFLIGDGCDPQKVVQNKEAVAILRQAIAEIEEKYRVVLVLRDIEQMSYEQVGQVLELEEGTVKSRLFRARAMLKELLLKKFE